jgi:hypothetical protein
MSFVRTTVAKRESRTQTLFDGRALGSADFGNGYNGSPPERPAILPLPPPTEFMPVQRSLRSETEVWSEAQAERRHFSTRTRRWIRNVRRHLRAALLLVHEMIDEVTDGVMAVAGHVRDWASAMNAVGGKQRTVCVSTKLRVRASDTAIASRHLDVGAGIVVYAAIASPSGWILAQHPEGEIGFVRTDHLLPAGGEV